MKLLVLGINYAPEIISTAVYSTGLAEDMAERGHAVRVVTGHAYYPEWKRHAGFPRLWYLHRDDGAVSPSQAGRSRDLQVTHCPHYIPPRPTGLRRVLHHASFALTALPVVLWQAARHRPDLVFVVAPALVAAPVGWLAARLVRAKTWLHVQDFEVEAAFATNLMRKDSRAGRIALRFERWMLRRFDMVSTISPAMMAKLAEKGIPPHRRYELRNWADLAAVTPLTGPSSLRAELGIWAPHVALYSGNIAHKQGLEIIADVAGRLAHRRDLHFVICGDGPLLPRLKELCDGLGNVSFHPLQPRSRLSDLVGMATVHLLPQIGGAADLVLPSKLTNMLASGRPVLATAAPGTALALEIEGCGLLTPPGDAEAMAAALQVLIDDAALRTILGAAARAKAVAHWDGSRILARLDAAFNRVTARKPRAALKAELDSGASDTANWSAPPDARPARQENA